METGGDNKNKGEHDLHQTSQLTEQKHGGPDNSPLEPHASSSSSPPSQLTEQEHGSQDNSPLEPHASSSSPPPSQNPVIVPSDATNNTGNECINNNNNNNSTSSTNPVGSTHQNSSPENESSPENPLHEPTNTDNKINVTTTNSSEHEHEQGAKQGSEIQNPPVQVMERPGESPQYVFPSHVFTTSNVNAGVEWSTASNESLFSIYMGNTSFSSDFMICSKSCELDRPGGGDVCKHDLQPPKSNTASPTHQPPDPAAVNNKFNDISKSAHELQLLHEKSSKATEAMAAETMREVIMESSRTTEDVAAKGDDKVFKAHHQSNGSANSYAFQSSKGRDGISVSTKGAPGEKQNQPKQPEENETPTPDNAAADQAPKSTTDVPAPNKWLGCFSCCAFC